MQTLAQRQKQRQKSTSSNLSESQAAAPGHDRGAEPGRQVLQAAGNQAVQRILTHARDTGAGAVQAKLAVSQPGDASEQEADRISELVMRMPEPQPGQGAEASTGGAEGPDQDSTRLQMKHGGSGGPAQAGAPSSVHEALRSPGQPLDAATRAFMEPRFGHDFSAVRVHTDARAAASARDVDALAYTLGPELVFAAGQYRPGTPEGQRLLAHELAHAVQQRSGGINRIQRQPRGSPVSPDLERLPPGPGEYAPKEYEAWLKAHPKREYLIGGPWEPDVLYARYTPKWFRSRGYVYAGRGGNYPWYWFEVWISDSDGGKEFRVWRTSDVRAQGSPSTSPVPAKGSGIEPDWIDPKANRQALFGRIIAAKEDVDAAFGEGDVVLYEDGTAELFLKGTLQSYVFRPVPGGRYIVYGPDGRRLEKVWTIPEEDIPDPDDDAVE